MFGRDKTQAPAATAPTAPPPVVKEGGKGRATPKRSEAQARNRTPVVGAAAALPKGATKEERKAARQAQTARNREDRVKQREAMATGDERYLPLRDKGPARRFTRDVVDARRNLGEFFMPIALVAVVLQFSRVYSLQVIAILLLYGLVIAIFVDAMLLRRKVIKLVTAKFGAESAQGVGGYAIMRSIQLRRSRMPRPQVARGQHPK